MRFINSRNKVAGLLMAAAVVFSLAGNFMASGCTRITPPRQTPQGNVGRQAGLNDNLPPTFAEEPNALTVPQIVRKAGAAVVGVSTRSVVQRRNGIGVGVQEGIGSGFIINEEGHVLTNYHVIAGAQEVRVICNDGNELRARVVNYDANQDIAMVRITERMKMPGIVELGNSDNLEVGESVVAIGNPLGREFIGTVTTGVVSAVNRGIEVQGRRLNFIQTDAAINPGNSGGPLLNSRGQVIGINTAKIGAQGIEGIGFSIPINTVKLRMEALSRPVGRIGIAALNVTEDISRRENLPKGIYIKDVAAGSCAADAGLQPGDVIVKFDGQNVGTAEDLDKLNNTHKAGDVIQVELIRGYKRMTMDIKLKE
jgi:serine protease Do